MRPGGSGSAANEFVAVHVVDTARLKAVALVERQHVDDIRSRIWALDPECPDPAVLRQLGEIDLFRNAGAKRVETSHGGVELRSRRQYHAVHLVIGQDRSEIAGD